MSTNQRGWNYTPIIGDVYLMKFDGTGNEQRGLRPDVVFQNNVGNAHSPNIIALPLTSIIKKASQPTHVIVRAADSGLLKDSMVLCENPEKISKTKLVKYLGHLSDDYMRQIATANLIATAAVSFLTVEDMLTIWEMSVQLNCVA